MTIVPLECLALQLDVPEGAGELLILSAPNRQQFTFMIQLKYVLQYILYVLQYISICISIIDRHI